MSTSFETVAMIGLGYIGLPTAALLASRGLQVIGVDVDSAAVATINEGKVHIVEPDLDIVVRSVVTTGNLRATTAPEPADVFLVAVPTPFKAGHAPDLSYVEAAAKSIAPVLRAGNLVVLESTIPVGTTEKMADWLADERPDLSFPQQAGEQADVQIAHCPERVLPGQVLQELVANDRVIGGMTLYCANQAAKLYKRFVKGECLITSARTAELCKLTENAYRDVNIAFANEMSLVCEPLEVNVWELIELANRHPRVNILTPGPGVGGHCIAIDPWFIVDSAPETARLIRTAREVNDSKPAHVANKVLAKAEKFKAPTIACFGLAFKADIDDLRQSPALDIVLELARRHAGRLLVVEPNIKKLPSQFDGMDDVTLVDQKTALAAADIVVGLVDHEPFKHIDRETLSENILIDTRGMWR
ncbi:MAG: UDP-N-acetyl-D-mannosamine dehydrogenase [Granulosicoccus sp.]